MGLEHVIGDLRTDLGALSLLEFGARELATFNTPPRYVWVPTASSYEAPMRVGSSPRAIYDQLVESSVYCWGDDDVDARLLERALVVALRRRLGATMSLMGTEYGKPDWLTLGYMAIVKVQTRVPFVELSWPETLTAREALRQERIAAETEKWPDPTTPEAHAAIQAIATASWRSFVSDNTAPNVQFKYVAIAAGTPSAGDGLLTGLEG